MTDPFLDAHQVDKLTFSIAGRLDPVSVRDQMVRALLFVERARRANLVGPHTAHPLVVAGSGAAAATAVLEAARHQIPTVWVSERPAAARFELQVRCDSRWLHPGEYEWPLRHCRTAAYPPDDPARAGVLPRHLVPPLPWRRPLRPHLLAAEWDGALADALAAGGGLSPHLKRYLDEWRLVDVERCGRKHRVRVVVRPTHRDDPDQDERIKASAVLLALGFGREVCQVSGSAAEGVPFWGSDRLCEGDFGVGNLAARVLVSGGGDGGLQDYIRAVVHPDFWRRAPHFIDLLDAVVDADAPVAFGNRRASVEDHALHLHYAAERVQVWGDRVYDHAPLNWVHDQYRQLAAAAYEQLDLGPRLASVLRPTATSVRLAYPCTHFGPVYPLNRFLVLLVARHCAPAEVLLPNTAIQSIRPLDGHDCKRYGRPEVGYCLHAPGCVHRVRLAPTAGSDRTCGRGRTHPAGEATGRDEDVDVLVLRHGGQPNQLPKTSEPRLLVPYRRQLLPYLAAY